MDISDIMDISENHEEYANTCDTNKSHHKDIENKGKRGRKATCFKKGVLTESTANQVNQEPHNDIQDIISYSSIVFIHF